MSKISKALEKAQVALAKARKKVRGVRESKTTQLIAKGATVLGAAAGAAGKLDGAINMLPGGHVGHADYTKAPSWLRYKRTLILGGLTAASAYFLTGIEGEVALPILAAAAGRSVAQHNATYYLKTAALTPEALSKDIGATEAAKVAAAKGYPQV